MPKRKITITLEMEDLLLLGYASAAVGVKLEHAIEHSLNKTDLNRISIAAARFLALADKAFSFTNIDLNEIHMLIKDYISTSL